MMSLCVQTWLLLLLLSLLPSPPLLLTGWLRYLLVVLCCGCAGWCPLPFFRIHVVLLWIAELR